MRKAVISGVITIVLAFGFSTCAFADLLSDWGVTPGTHWGPTDSAVEYHTSDGVLVPGNGGDEFDVEALYFSHSLSTAYIALVTGMPKEGIGHWSAPPGQNLYPGDFALNFGDVRDLDNNLVYQFGIRATSNTGSGGVVGGNPGDIYKNISWGEAYEWYGPTYHGWENNPTVIESGDKLNTNATFAYIPWMTDHQHYVYEVSLPLNIAGMDWSSGGNIHWTTTCGNDVENLSFKAIPTPEPISSTLFLLGAGALGARLYRRKKKA